MKRSEMTSLIMYYLTRFDIDPKQVNIEADELLKRIEKAGMLPPFKKEACYCSMRGTCPTCSPKLYTSEWEPEE